MESEGRTVKNPGFKRRFHNPDGTFEDLSYLDVENRVEAQVQERLGVSIDDISSGKTDRDFLDKYLDIDHDVRYGRPSSSLYLIDGNTFIHRQTLQTLGRSCYSPGTSVVVFEGLSGSEEGRRYEAEITGASIKVQKELS